MYMDVYLIGTEFLLFFVCIIFIADLCEYVTADLFEAFTRFTNTFCSNQFISE